MVIVARKSVVEECELRPSEDGDLTLLMQVINLSAFATPAEF